MIGAKKQDDFVSNEELYDTKVSKSRSCFV